MREVFLRVQPPQVGLTRGGVKAIVAGACRAGGGASRIGCATPRLPTCCGLALRWPRSARCYDTARLGSTAVYARVDVEAVAHQIARPWPAGAGS